MAASTVPTILIVDDNADNRVAFQSILSREDRHIEAVASGEDALKFLLAHDVILILLDVRMPGLDGYATARLVRQRAANAAIPILFITADPVDHGQFLKGLESGAVDCIYKPVSADVLNAKVDVLIELVQKTRLLASQAQMLRDAAKRETLLRQLEDERDRLKESQSQLHDRIRELEEFHDAVVGRELKMIDLEKEVHRLRAELAELQKPGNAPEATGSVVTDS